MVVEQADRQSFLLAQTAAGGELVDLTEDEAFDAAFSDEPGRNDRPDGSCCPDPGTAGQASRSRAVALSTAPCGGRAAAAQRDARSLLELDDDRARLALHQLLLVDAAARVELGEAERRSPRCVRN